MQDKEILKQWENSWLEPDEEKKSIEDIIEERWSYEEDQIDYTEV